jgi:hypothetical protein
MAFNTNAKRQQPGAGWPGQTPRQPATGAGFPHNRAPQGPGAGAKKSKGGLFDNPLDRNGDGFITPDDLLIGMREVFQWVFSWRGAMLLAGAFTIGSAAINVYSWTNATGTFAAGFLTWGVIQTLELMPAFDSFNLKSNIAALVRMQRKPVEVPTANATLNPGFHRKLRSYQNREKNQEMFFEAIRWICYGLEFAVLVVGGGLLSATGVSGTAVILALVGIAGVEVGLRLTNVCGDKLLSADERRYLEEIQASVQRSSVRVQ